MDCKTVLLLLGMVAVAAGVTCYQCGALDSSCNDEYSMPADHEVDCAATVDAAGLAVSNTNDGGCSKVKSKWKVFGTEFITAVRDCGKGSYGDCTKDKLSIGGFSTEVWSCGCDGDKCNSGYRPAVSLLTLAGLLLTALFY